MQSEGRGGLMTYALFEAFRRAPRDSPETCDDGDDDENGDDGDDGFVPGMPFVCPLRRKSYGIVLIVEILASERSTERGRE